MINPKVSIIIPVYNADAYLEECIAGIRRQTFDDYEVIMVNDGSNDGSAAICEAYAGGDGRVQVIHKSNGGVSSARNLGLENAKGEWIVFIDADDRIDDNYLSNLYAGVSDTVDIVIAGFHPLGKDLQGVSSFKDEMIAQSELGKCLAQYMKTMPFGTPWSKLFRASVIKNSCILFDTKIRFNEDSLFNQQFFHAMTKGLQLISAQDYHWRVSDSKYKYGTEIEEYEYTLMQLTRQYELVTKKFSFENETYIRGLFVAHTIRLLTGNGHMHISWAEYRKFKKSLQRMEPIKHRFVADQRGIVVSFMFDLIRNKHYFLAYILVDVVYPVRLKLFRDK